MLKLWVTSENLISYHSISKLLLQSAPAAAIKDNRLIFSVYLIILTTYFLLDVTKQSVAANPDIISQGSEQPKPIAQSMSAINDRCLLKIRLNCESITQTSEVALAKGRESCRIDRQNRSKRVSEKSRISSLAPCLVRSSGEVSSPSRIRNLGGTGIESPPELGDLGGVRVIDRTFQTPSNPDIALADSLAEPLVGTRRFSSLRDAAPCAYGTRMEWLLTAQAFDSKILDLLKPDDLLLLPKFVASILPPVPADRPFITPTTPPVSPVLAPQNREPIQLPQIKPLPTAIPDPRYLIAPRLLKLGQFNPALTLIAINDVALTHRSQIEVTSGVETGDRRSTDIGLNATGLFSPQVEESVSNKRVYRLDYWSNYSQIRTLRQQREITTKVTTPETLFGARQQISFTGDCLVGMNNGNSVSPTGEKLICTYLPGLKTDESSIDPQKLIPTRIPSTSSFGDLVSSASRLAIQAPGFQGGANGQLIGLDLYFPRIGAQSGNSQAQDSSFERFESNTTVPMVAVGRIHQVILANGTETAIARTVRGFNYILGDVNTSQIAGIQAATELLPDLEPSLPDGKKGGSTTVDRNLILAANNNRTPENSFTAYYSGVGRGTTPKDEQINSANYHGVWIGFSPVVDRQVTLIEPIYKILGPERISLSAGGEGGIDSNTNVTALLNQNTFDSSAITNGYVQTYITRYEREVNTLSSTTIRERTNYHPHLSATGNITTQDSVLRYYTGLIFNPNFSSRANHKGYLGVDFTKAAGGLSYNLAAIGYLNPDTEYYSKLTGTISKQLGLGRNPANNLNLSAGVNYAIDGTKIFDEVSFRSANSYVNVGARANLGNVAVGTTYYLATGMPNSIGNLLSTNASWKISDGLVLSGYYTPVNDNVARSPFGASASIRLGSNIYSPTLSLGWNRNEIDLGTKSDNTRSGVADNVFSIFLRFDAPPNSFK